MIDLNSMIPFASSLYQPTKLYGSDNAEKAIASYGTNYQSNALNGDYFITPLYCIGGETILDVSLMKNPAGGIIDIYIDNTLNTSGYDTYAASNTNLVLSVSVGALSTGNHILKFVLNSKNASSSAYIFTLYGVRLR